MRTFAGEYAHCRSWSSGFGPGTNGYFHHILLLFFGTPKT